LRAAQVQGGGLRDSFLVDGVAFKKTFSYAGFEMQPKAYEKPGILLLNIELELKSEKENAEVGGPPAPRAAPGAVLHASRPPARRGPRRARPALAAPPAGAQCTAVRVSG